MKLHCLLFLSALLTACNMTNVKHANTTPTSLPSVPLTASQTGELKPYVLPNTQTFSIDSKETGNTYNIVVTLPANYNPADTTRKYPVMYVLDGQWQYPLFYIITGAIHYDGDMPEVILVGVSWKETNGNLMALRNLDLTPTQLADLPLSGGAKKFQSFFQHELFTYIDSHFHTNEHRTVTGGSTSSLFAFYTLISQPDLFDGYIASSPSLYWDHHVMDKILDQASVNLIKNKTRAYLSWGSLEGSQDTENFAKRLKAKNFKNLEINFAPVANAGHAGVNAECYTRGIQFVYQKPDITLSKPNLMKVTGAFHNATDNYDAVFSVVDGVLYITYPDGDKLKLKAESEQDFYVQGLGLEYSFKADKNNIYSVMTQRVHGDASEFTRK